MAAAELAGKRELEGAPPLTERPATPPPVEAMDPPPPELDEPEFERAAPGAPGPAVPLATSPLGRAATAGAVAVADLAEIELGAAATGVVELDVTAARTVSTGTLYLSARISSTTYSSLSFAFAEFDAGKRDFEAVVLLTFPRVLDLEEVVVLVSACAEGTVDAIARFKGAAIFSIFVDMAVCTRSTLAS